jgi:hypothetical protein
MLHVRIKVHGPFPTWHVPWPARLDFTINDAFLVFLYAKIVQKFRAIVKINQHSLLSLP